MVNFRGKEYFDERQVVEVLLEENEQLKAKIAEQENLIKSFQTVIQFITKTSKESANSVNQLLSRLEMAI